MRGFEWNRHGNLAHNDDVRFVDALHNNSQLFCSTGFSRYIYRVKQKGVEW